MKKSGRILVVAELAREYGFKDVGGNTNLFMNRSEPVDQLKQITNYKALRVFILLLYINKQILHEIFTTETSFVSHNKKCLMALPFFLTHHGSNSIAMDRTQHGSINNNGSIANCMTETVRGKRLKIGIYLVYIIMLDGNQN